MKDFHNVVMSYKYTAFFFFLKLCQIDKIVSRFQREVVRKDKTATSKSISKLHF